MSSFPIPENENNRLISLDSYGIMDTENEVNFDELTLLASEICRTPIALISLVDDKRQWFKSHFGLPVSETPKEQAFCSHAIMKPMEVMIVNDAREDKRFMANPLVTGDPRIVFYAGVPLVTGDGFPLGTLCVIDREPRELTEKQIKSLTVLAKQVFTQLELKKKLVELEKANQVLEETNGFIREFARSAAHDIKNPLSSILMTSQLLKNRLTGDEKNVRLAEMSISSSKQLLELVNHMLDYSLKPSLLFSGQTEIELNILLKKITDLVQHEHVTVNLPTGENRIKCSAIALEQIFLNLLTNAVRYNDKPHTFIDIQFWESDQDYHFSVGDNGIGMEKHHFEKIFERHIILGQTDRSGQKGTGIGLASVKNLVGKLGGQIKVESELGKGSVFSFSIRKKLEPICLDEH